MRICSNRTGQHLFDVDVKLEEEVFLDPEDARKFLECLRDLGDPSIMITVAGGAPTPIDCMFGGRVTRELDLTRSAVPTSIKEALS